MENQYQEFYPFSREPEVQEDFRNYLQGSTNKKHISTERKHSLIQWLGKNAPKPQTQKDYSLRNYATKTYKWDSDRHILWGIGKSEKEKGGKSAKSKKGGKGGKGSKGGKCQDRVVVTEDEILNVVEQIHMSNDHGGWDATWDEVNSKYCGIVRSDVIFLLKRCYICQLNPRKHSRRNEAPDEAPASSSSLPTPSSEPQSSQEEPQFYEQQTAEDQDFDQILDQISQQTYDFDFGSDNHQYGSFEGLDQLWSEEVPDAEMTDIDPSLLNNSFQDFMYTYPPPEEASGSDTYPYDFDFMQHSV